MWLSKTASVFVSGTSSSLSLSLSQSMANFSNQASPLYGADSLMTQWMNGGLRCTSESLSKLCLCVWKCVCVTASACVRLRVWSLPAVARLWIRSNRTTHSDNGSHTVHTACAGLSWTEGPWPGVTLILTTTSIPLLKCCLFCYLFALLDSGYLFQGYK